MIMIMDLIICKLIFYRQYAGIVLPLDIFGLILNLLICLHRKQIGFGSCAGHLFVYDLFSNCATGWGSNYYNQLGCTQPGSIIKIPNNELIKTIQCGSGHSVCLTTIGTVYSWGLNNRGQLGT